MGNKCKHNRIKRKMITEGKPVGKMFKVYCNQCMKWREITLTDDDIRTVYPNGRPGDE